MIGLLAEEIGLFKTVGELIHVELTIDNQTMDIKEEEELKEIFANFSNSALLFVNTGTNRSVSINNIWVDVINQTPGLIDNVIPNRQPRRKTVKVNFTNPNGRYAIKLRDKNEHVLGATFIADIRVELSTIPISKITRYSVVEESQSIAESVYFDLPVGDEKINLTIHKLNNQDGSQIAITSRKE